MPEWVGILLQGRSRIRKERNPIRLSLRILRQLLLNPGPKNIKGNRGISILRIRE
jgi:hypothetical protein